MRSRYLVINTFVILLIGILLPSFVGCKDKPLTQIILFELPDTGLIDTADFRIKKERTFEIIKTRLENFGYESMIRRGKGGDKLHYNLFVPEDANPFVVKHLLTTTGKMAIWETMNLETIIDQLPVDSLAPFLMDARNGYASLGSVLVKDTAEVMSILNAVEGLPYRTRFMWASKAEKDPANRVYLYIIRSSNIKGLPVITDEDIEKAHAQEAHYSHKNWEIGIDLKKTSWQKWENATKDNIGRCLVFAIDDKVYSAPMVNSQITGGKSMISGNISEMEAKEIAAILQSGALPLAVKVIN